MLVWNRILGSSDCELCGVNIDQVSVEWLPEGNCWEATLQVGCYGGDQVQGTGAELIDYIIDHWAQVLSGTDLQDLKRTLENTVCQYWNIPLDEGQVEGVAGDLNVERLDGQWDVEFAVEVDGVPDFESVRGSWGKVRQWLLNDAGPNYLHQNVLEKVVARVESETTCENDHAQVCCTTHGTHATPHRQCIMR